MLWATYCYNVSGLHYAVGYILLSYNVNRLHYAVAYILLSYIVIRLP